MKAEETKKLDAMMDFPPAKPKAKKKKKKVTKSQPSEEPPPQDELPISLPPAPSEPGVRVAHLDRQIHKEEVSQSMASKDVAESRDVEESAVKEREGREREVGGDSESEEEEVQEKEDKKEKKPRKETATDLISDTYNGAALDNYKWSQTMTDVDVKVPIAPGTRSKDVTVDIKSDHLKVILHKPERKVSWQLILIYHYYAQLAFCMLYVHSSLSSLPSLSLSLTPYFSVTGCNRWAAS